MKMTIQFLISKIKYIIIIYTVIQLVLIIATNISYRSDSLYYFKLAQDCIENNEFYPASTHLFEDYIVAPLYVNALIILLRIFNSTTMICMFNLATVFLTVFFLYNIALREFSIDTARLTIILYILYLNTLGLVFQNYADLFFVLLLSASIYFYLLRTNWAMLISGIFLGASIAVRPVGWALLAALLSIHFFIVINKNKLESNRISVYAGALFFIIAFGLFTYSNSGRFEFTSTTGPINLLLGANDDATGGFNSKVLETGKAGFIDDSIRITYTERGEFYKNQAIKWIKENPNKWLMLAPMKFFHTFLWDDISLSSLLGFDDTNFAKVIKTIFAERSLETALQDSSTLKKLKYFTVISLSHIYYFFILLIIVNWLLKYIRQKQSIEIANIIILFAFFSIVMIMLTTGAPRYKYPAIILLMPIAANYLVQKFRVATQSNA